MNVLPFGLVTVRETAAPPIAFPPLSVTRTVKYSIDFCVVVGESIVSVTCKEPVLFVEDVEADVVEVDEVKVDDDEVEVDMVVVDVAEVVELVGGEDVVDVIEVVEDDDMEVMVDDEGAVDVVVVVDDVDVPAFHNEVPATNGVALPPRTIASTGRDVFWTFPSTPHALPIEFADRIEDQTPPFITWIAVKNST